MSTAGFLTITSEGGLIPADLLARLASDPGSLPDTTPDAYHLPPGRRLRDAINRSWNDLVGAWQAWHTQLDRLSDSDPATGLTRDRWQLHLFSELGYGRLPAAQPITVDGRSYPVSHRWGNIPVHLVGANVDLDRRTPGVRGAATASPHSMVQELLNRSDEHLWAVLCNGRKLRLLRDNSTLTRTAYIEFDLDTMFAEQQFGDFVVLWMLAHQSRLEGDPPNTSVLERWVQDARRQGVRVLERLADGVRTAIITLGAGFLADPANRALRDRLRDGTLDPQEYYRQLLRVVYRLVFLLVCEDRDLLHPPADDLTDDNEKMAARTARNAYRDWYSVGRLRTLARHRRGTRHTDMWEGLKVVARALGDEHGLPALALPALNGHLWSPDTCPDLDTARLPNSALLAAVRSLAYTEQDRVLRPVDYRNLGAEELGSVYETLLELAPTIDTTAATFELREASGNERKTTGSYYTPTTLIEALLDASLDPLLDEAATQPDPEHAVLSLTVCDPACGSGHFLVAAAQRIARRLAQIRSGESEPTPTSVRHALREVIGRCLYGIDINPMAVELCKVNLWLEAMEPGKPLTFLDAHIICGNALVGATPAMLNRPLPAEAFTPIEGDDKTTARNTAKAHQAWLKNQRQGTLDLAYNLAAAQHTYAEALTGIDRLPDDTVTQIREKERRWAEATNSAAVEHLRLVADAYCAAFFDPKTRPVLADGQPDPNWQPIDGRTLTELAKSPELVHPATIERIRSLAARYRFCHPHLAFPQVFFDEETTSRGFDLVVGNPPWVSYAGRAAQPIDPRLRRYLKIIHPGFGGYPSLHGAFVSHVPDLIRRGGRMAMLIPTSVADLDGYAPARREVTSKCKVNEPLVGFRADEFAGVFQPCMALIAQRKNYQAGRDERWALHRNDLCPLAESLIARLCKLPTLPGGLFGERGFQTDKRSASSLAPIQEPVPSGWIPIREGSDVTSYRVKLPNLMIPRDVLGKSIASCDVPVVVRQTARYPIAARNDGTPFRNSLLACFPNSETPAELLLGLLNSRLIRWLHYNRFRDAREGMPQVKVSHLRSIPAPDGLNESLEEVIRSAVMDLERDPSDDEARTVLDKSVYAAYKLTQDEAEVVESWAMP